MAQVLSLWSTTLHHLSEVLRLCALAFVGPTFFKGPHSLAHTSLPPSMAGRQGICLSFFLLEFIAPTFIILLTPLLFPTPASA